MILTRNLAVESKFSGKTESVLCWKTAFRMKFTLEINRYSYSSTIYYSSPPFFGYVRY